MSGDVYSHEIYDIVPGLTQIERNFWLSKGLMFSSQRLLMLKLIISVMAQLERFQALPGNKKDESNITIVLPHWKRTKKLGVISIWPTWSPDLRSRAELINWGDNHKIDFIHLKNRKNAQGVTK